MTRTASRGARLAAWLVLTGALAVSLATLVHPWYDPTNDGSMYIATARSLAAGEGYRYLGEPFRIRPPGFPALLAPLVAVRGTDFHAFHLLVAASGALGVLLFHLLLRERLGLLLATAVPLVLWFNPGHQRLCNQVMSDVPGWTLLVACLLLARRPRARTVRGALGLGLVLGLATLVRSGNLLLLPALVVADLLRSRWPGPPGGLAPLARRSGALVLGALLVLAPWSIRNRLVAAPPPADQTLLYSYASGMWHTDMGDPRSPRVPLAEVVARFPLQTGKSLHTLGTRLREGEGGPWTLPVALLLLAALGLSAWRRRAPEELFAFATLAVVAFYFGYAGRLLLPIFALALAALIELVRDGCARVAGARVGQGVALLACGVWLALDWAPREGWDEIEARHRAHQVLAAQVNARLPAQARLGAYRGWHHAVYLDRPVHSFEQACARAAGGPGDRQAIAALVERYDLDAIWLGELGLPEPVAREERSFAAAVVGLYGGTERGLVGVR